ALARQRFGLHTDVLGIEVLRAGIERAEIALAAIERGDHGVGAGGKAERLHGAMRLNGMPKQKARTKFRAEAALVAGRSANAVDLNHGRVVALDKAMRGWQ